MSFAPSPPLSASSPLSPRTMSPSPSPPSAWSLPAPPKTKSLSGPPSRSGSSPGPPSMGRCRPAFDFVVALVAEQQDGSDYGPSPRALLRRVGQRARTLGFLPKFGSEYEFFIFKETPQSLRTKGFQNLEPLTPGMFGYSWLRTSQSSALVHALHRRLQRLRHRGRGLPHRDGPRASTRPRSATTMLEAAADKAVLFKTVVKEICARHGLTACFMAKPNAKLPGCSGHVHQSLWTLDGRAKHLPRSEGANGGSRRRCATTSAGSWS